MQAIIGGTSLLGSSLFADWDTLETETPFGTVSLRIKDGRYFIQRHGNPPAPPHRINHRSHIWALRSLGVEQVTAINSAGSLNVNIRPGSFVVPHDFVSFWDVPTFFDSDMKFVVPEMDQASRDRLLTKCGELGMNVAPGGGVYIQTRGPRLETRAEIAFLKGFGDLVGMTMASEATLCMEAGIPYASLCSIDNYCHGIAEVPLTMEEIEQNGRKSLQVIEALIARLLLAD